MPKPASTCRRRALETAASSAFVGLEHSEQHGWSGAVVHNLPQRLTFGNRGGSGLASVGDDGYSSITGAATTPYPCASSRTVARSASSSPPRRIVSVPPRSCER
jgi:hypothetical protein